jgi:hypothetical protein
MCVSVCVTSQLDTVDAVLLARPDADRLPAGGVAHRVGLHDKMYGK